MGKKRHATARLVKWQEVKKKISKVNPAFGKVIDKMDLRGGLDLYLVRYPYGSAIIENGCFYFPLENGALAPIDSPLIPEKTRKQLGYNSGSIPLGIVLHNSTELFIPTEDRIIPFSTMAPGKIFALWSVLNRSKTFWAIKIWSMNAGARSIFLLPKFSDSIAYKKLARARNIKLPLPRKLFDHGPVMGAIAQHEAFADDWYVEMLFFSTEWMQKQDTETWKDFHRYLLQEGWDTTEYWRNKIVYDLVWDLFVKKLGRQGIKTNSRTIDIVKHLVAINAGALPGFSPAIDNEAAPIEALQNDLQEIYGFKDQFPTIMVPRYYSPFDPRPVYWSFQYPTYFESYPKRMTENSTLVDLREAHYLLDHFYNAILHRAINEMVNVPLYDLINQTEVAFFHNESDQEGIVRSSGEIPKEDASFMQSSSASGSRIFALHGPFVRGCVRLSVKKK